MLLSPSRWAAVATVTGTLALVACGGGNGSNNNNGYAGPAASSTPTTTAAAAAVSSSGAGTTDRLSAAADGSLKFNTSSLTAKAGKVTLDMSNPSSSGQPHGISITGNGVNAGGNVVQPGQSATATATLKPGKYTFFCPVPGHREAGMQGTLTVK